MPIWFKIVYVYLSLDKQLSGELNLLWTTWKILKCLVWNLMYDGIFCNKDGSFVGVLQYCVFDVQSMIY